MITRTDPMISVGGIGVIPGAIIGGVMGGVLGSWSTSSVTEYGVNKYYQR